MLDVRWPPERLNTLITRMGARVVVADSAVAAGLAADGRTIIGFNDLDHLAPGLRPTAADTAASDSCATVFWTSGSTGTPKAVLSHHHATTRLMSGPGALDLGDPAVMVNAAAVAWDAFTLELWGTLLSGGTLVVHAADVLLPSDLRYYIHELGVTTAFMTPALADVLVAGDIECLDGLSVLLLGGDKPSRSTCLALRKRYPKMRLINGYGPVESCVFATTHEIDDQTLASADPIPAGTPVAGTQIHILTPDDEVAAIDEVGAVALSGHGLATGYLDDPDRTAESFHTIEISGTPTRVYLTGDRGFLDTQGRLHFRGRDDHQVKIAGHRIEPAEIEAAARAAGATRAVVLRGENAHGAPFLVLIAETTAITDRDLTTRLRAQLPAYMLPRRTHVVDTMPLLDNTKIDRRTLQTRYVADYLLQGAIA